jgi:hypothetical protein
VWFAVIGAKTSISTAAMPMTLKASPVFEFIKIDYFLVLLKIPITGFHISVLVLFKTNEQIPMMSKNSIVTNVEFLLKFDSIFSM